MEPARTLEETFRRSSGSVVAALTRALGPGRLDLVESVVQEAFARALLEWRGAVPDNPAGWVHAVARNLALDHLRREKALRAREDAIAHHVVLSRRDEGEQDPCFAGELADDQLRMLFVACHPCNSLPSAVALALRTLCGLDPAAIARAMLSTEDAVERRLVHARRRVREAGVSFEVPSVEELDARLDAVLRVLYLLFNEAYWSPSSPDLVLVDVGLEAIRHTTRLAAHPATRRPRVLAALALMHFHAARFPARVAVDGTPLSLAEQDRSTWSEAHIEVGLRALAASAEGDEPSPYHFEAAIAAVHVTSASYEETDWARIVSYYDDLLSLQPSPGARLSRAVALGHACGPAAGLEAIGAIAPADLPRGAAADAARAEALMRLGESNAARTALERAQAAALHEHERSFIARRLARLGVRV